MIDYQQKCYFASPSVPKDFAYIRKTDLKKKRKTQPSKEQNTVSYFSPMIWKMTLQAETEVLH